MLPGSFFGSSIWGNSKRAASISGELFAIYTRTPANHVRTGGVWCFQDCLFGGGRFCRALRLAEQLIERGAVQIGTVANYCSDAGGVGNFVQRTFVKKDHVGVRPGHNRTEFSFMPEK